MFQVITFDTGKNGAGLDIGHYRVFLVEKGEGIISDGFREIPIHEGTLYFFTPGEVVRLEGKGEGTALGFSPTFLPQELHTLKQLFSPYYKEPYLRVNNTMRPEVDVLLQLIGSEFNREVRDHAILRTLLHALLLYALRMRSGIVRKQNTWRQERMARIETLIEAHFKREHYAPFYARQMNLSTQYLNTLLKRHLGKTLTKLLAERIILEAKRELLHTPQSVTSIAEELGFTDPSYFARYFKKETGLSPIAFRESFKKYR